MQPWTSETMAAPTFDFLILVGEGTQVFAEGEWMSIVRMLSCAIEAHGPMCNVFRLDDGWDEQRIVHLRVDRRGWFRHPIRTLAMMVEAGYGAS